MFATFQMFHISFMFNFLMSTALIMQFELARLGLSTGGAAYQQFWTTRRCGANGTTALWISRE
uniref:Uncharacterized protein n=1 Tax=Arundo donax TaxID=35708 RepID=A0A0A9A3R3_ARUDO